MKNNAKRNKTTELLASCADLRRAALTAVMNESSPSFANELLLLSTSVTDLVSFKSGDTKKAGQNRFIASVARADGNMNPRFWNGDMWTDH